jgi:hypothetical protein
MALSSLLTGAAARAARRAAPRPFPHPAPARGPRSWALPGPSSTSRVFAFSRTSRARVPLNNAVPPLLAPPRPLGLSSYDSRTSPLPCARSHSAGTLLVLFVLPVRFAHPTLTMRSLGISGAAFQPAEGHAVRPSSSEAAVPALWPLTPGPWPLTMAMAGV